MFRELPPRHVTQVILYAGYVYTRGGFVEMVREINLPDAMPLSR
jgi:hypothetical protein